MAFTRKMLKALGIEEDKIEQIIEAHAETVDAIKAERDSFKEDATKLAEVQKELTKAQAKLEENSKGGFEEKYKQLQTEFDNYKAEIDGEKKTAAKSTAYRDLLKATGVSEKRLDSILKLDIKKLEKINLDENGRFKDDDKAALAKTIKEEWADFIETSGTKGAAVSTPPAGGRKPGKMTREEIKDIKDRKERIAAIARNLGEFNN